MHQDSAVHLRQAQPRTALALQAVEVAEEEVALGVA